MRKDIKKWSNEINKVWKSKENKETIMVDQPVKRREWKEWGREERVEEWELE